jgi:glycosyltransferase involved in cell wall biosynthesis
MRIAVVGSGRSVHAVSRSVAVAARGHEVRFVTVGDVLPAPGIEVRTRPLPRGAVAAARAARSFLSDLRRFQPDLLHLHYAGGKLGTMAALGGIHPMVVTVMGGDVLPEQHPGGLSLLERRATRRILEQADLLLVKSTALRTALCAWGGFAAKAEVVRWGVDPARFRRDPAAAVAMRSRLAMSPRDRVILSPRPLVPLYNVHLIVDAMPKVLAAVPEALAVITEHNADPAYRESLRQRGEVLGLGDRVRFVGAIPAAEMSALHSLAEAIVSVPSSDGLPQSLFEAMACGTPAVLGRLPAYSEVVTDDESALLVDHEAAAVAFALVRLLSDEHLHARLAGRALERVGEVAFLPRELDRVEAFYRALVARGPRPASNRGRLLDLAGLLLR